MSQFQLSYHNGREMQMLYSGDTDKQQYDVVINDITRLSQAKFSPQKFLQLPEIV